MFSSKNQFLTGAGGYRISRSVRLRSSATAYFNRTFGTPTSATTWTWSGWVKRGALGSANFALFSRYIDASNFAQLRFTSSSGDELRWYEAAAGVAVSQRDTTQIFRDPSAWYHIVLAYDTTQSVAADRVKIYINGAQVTAFATTVNRAQNASGLLNAAAAHQIGALNAAANFDGYLTEINFIDGQALTPSSFGENDAITGVWKPKKYTGTYGTNGFYLNFSDNSAATATTIGKDNSGNGNNWTPNNISVTAGVTYDSMLDVPTLYADGGNGRGNYCVLNAVNKNSNTTLSAGNLDIKSTTTGWSDATGTIGVSSGKWYWEVTVVSGVGGAEEARCGILKDGFALPSIGGYNAGSYVYSNNGNKYNNSTGVAYGATFTNGDIIGVALDLDAGTLAFYKNNTSQGTAYSGLSGVYFPEIAQSSNPLQTANFGQRPFTYTPPTGFVALNTQNLPTPTISNGAAYMAATLYTGNNTTNVITNSGSMQPDLVWMKARSAAYSNTLTDSVRGVSTQLFSNLTNAETTEAGKGLTAFNSNGFTLSTDLVATGSVNANGVTYVGWQWKKGATQGFDIVTYTGNGTSQNISHSLGVAPRLMIVKNRATASNWCVWHGSFGTASNTDYLFLQTTGAKGGSGSLNFWNNTPPTSSVLTVGSDSNTNNSGQSNVAYLFAAVAGYSAFGSYTGNGSADGPFVYCGFRPRYVLIKRTDAAGNWNDFDTSRNTYNGMNNLLLLNTADAEVAGGVVVDSVSNGFKLRDSSANWNASGGTYIYAAFAENPFKISLAR
jgi:hypothetical protein